MDGRSKIIRRSVTSAIAGCLALLLVAVVPAMAHDTHRVRSGDTLSEIAADHGTTWQALFRLNRGVINDPDLIYPGQVFALEPDNHRGGGADKRPANNTPKVDVSTSRPGTGHVTSPYGMRTHPITGVYKLHTGTDYSYGDGNAYAVRGGVVASVEWNAAYGNLVTLDHGSVVTRYAHLASVRVNDGERVSRGEVVGRIGSTGYSTGAHLHFEVIRGGDFVNPAGWLD